MTPLKCGRACGMLIVDAKFGSGRDAQGMVANEKKMQMMRELQELFNEGLITKAECDRRMSEVSQGAAEQEKHARAHLVKKHAHSMPSVKTGAAAQPQLKADMIALLELELQNDHGVTHGKSPGGARHIHTSNYHRPSMRMAASHDQAHYAHNFVRGKGKDKTYRKHSGTCGGGSHNF